MQSDEEHSDTSEKSRGATSSGGHSSAASLCAYFTRLSQPSVEPKKLRKSASDKSSRRSRSLDSAKSANLRWAQNELLESSSVGGSSESSTGDLFTRELTKLAKHLAKHFEEGIDPSDRWLADLYSGVKRRHAERMVQSLPTVGCSSNRPGFAVIFHEENPETTEGHLHIYHSCRYTGSFCKCSWYKRFIQIGEGLQKEKEGGIFGRGRLKQRDGKRLIRRRRRSDKIYVSALKEKYWINWLLYFLKSGRTYLCCEVNEVAFLEKICRLKDLQQSVGLQECQVEPGSLQGCQLQSETFGGESDVSTEDEEDHEAAEEASEGTGGKRARVSGSETRRVRLLKKSHERTRRLCDYIKEFMCVPLTGACETKQWMDNPELSLYDHSDPDYKRAVGAVQREISLWTFMQFCSFYDTHDKMQWAGKHPNHYMPLEESVKYIEDLLEHQSRNEPIKNFIQVVYNICEKVEPKKNSLFILGPPNCGKTWFAEMLAGYYCNTGEVGNFNKNTSFPLNDCPNRRLLIWNEPNVEKDAMDTVKMLTAGDPCPANIKYQSGVVIHRTPLIFTSNKQIFPMTEVWTSRIHFVQWRQAPFLKEAPGYPHPRCWDHLVLKYVLN